MVLISPPGSNFWQPLIDFMRDHLLAHGLISADDFHLFSVTNSIDAAVDEVLQFYQNFHSSRWVQDQLVLRLQHAIADHEIKRMEIEFSDLLLGEKITQGSALPAEENEPAVAPLPRLIFSPHRRNFGRLRLLINRVNQAEKA